MKSEAPLTELGNMERFIGEHGENLLFCPQTGKWYVWNGHTWEIDSNGHVHYLAKSNARKLLDEARRINDDLKRNALLKWAILSERKHIIDNVVALSKTDPAIAISISRLDSNNFLLGTKNGIVDLNTQKIITEKTKDCVTKICNVEYNSQAICPRWDSFLEEITASNKKLTNFLQRMAGYCLSGSTEEQCLFIFHGGGANGKSVFTNILKSLFNDYAVQTPPETLMVRNNQGASNDLARLRGARLVLATESEENQTLAEAQIKQMTGGDVIVARHLYSEFFEFIPNFKIILTTNHRPKITGTDHAIWRRIRLIPFTVTIPEEKRDPKLSSILMGELPGILNWALEGFKQWQEQGLNPPRCILEATSGYRTEQDVLGEWLFECTIQVSNKTILTFQLYDSYVIYCDEAGLSQVSKNKFSRSLSERGYIKKKTSLGSAFTGISFK